MLGPRTFTPLEQDFFDELATLFVNLACLTAAVESFTTPESITIPHNKDHWLRLTGRVAHVDFPTNSLMHFVVRNQWPEELQFVFHPGTLNSVSPPSSVELKSEAIATLITQKVGVMFLKYYERNANRAKQAYGTSPKIWPETWRFGWVLRNAIAHGDKWAIDDLNFPETIWHSVKITSADSGKPWYHPRHFIGGGDVILLMEEMDASINNP